MCKHKWLLIFELYFFVYVIGEDNKNSSLVDESFKNCDYYQMISSDQTSYFIFSPNYPEKYKPNSNCRWHLEATEDHKIAVHCHQMEVPESVNCSDDSLAISTSGDELLTDAEKLCGPVSFVAISDRNDMILVFTSSGSSEGGIFSCSVSSQYVPNSHVKLHSQKKFMYQRDVSAVARNQPDFEESLVSDNLERSLSSGKSRKRKRSSRSAYATASASAQIEDNIINETDEDALDCDDKGGGSKCDCGWTSFSRIVNGEAAGRHEFPSQAGLLIAETGRVYCGGVIITDRHIVTAAHCIVETPPGTPAALINGYQIGKGNYSAGSRLYEFMTTFVHPKFDQKASINDLGIIRIRGTFNFDESVAPVCLPFKHRGGSFVGEWVQVAGWGTLAYGGRQSAILQKTTLQVIPMSNCSEVFGKANTRNNQMCAIDQKGSDTCQGDSGGPLLWTDPRTSRFVLVGIVSYGNGCASGQPSVNTRISAPMYLKWIRKITPGYQFCVP